MPAAASVAQSPRFSARAARVVVNYRSDEEAADETVAAVGDAHEVADAIAVHADASETF